MGLPAPITRDLSRNVGLDACRASAIVLVVFGHGVGYLERLFPNVFQVFQFSGFIGVELFFVLSGFLVGQMLMRQVGGGVPSWLGTFYLRRLFRTLPSYVMFLGGQCSVCTYCDETCSVGRLVDVYDIFQEFRHSASELLCGGLEPRH